MDARILPELFQVAYEMLWCRALGDGGPGAGVGNHPLSGQAGVVGVAGKGGEGGKVENAGWRTSSGQEDLIGRNAGPAKKPVGKTSRTMQDERAFEFKRQIDRHLRRLARQIQAFERGEDPRGAGRRVCQGRCKRFGDVEWKYCPHCGGPMMDQNQKV